MVYYITGTPILSKQTLSFAPGGGIHSEVSLTSGSSWSFFKSVYQYYIGEVTMQPLPEIGLKQKSSC